jgi:Catalytic LigB subunit of aromatic ring-opening dioxygenase
MEITRMGEILGLGITHYPALTGRVPSPISLKRLLKDPGLPERYRTPAGWPETMRHEWGNDEGASFALKHKDEVIAEIRKVRAALDAFKPDFVLIWGDDQYENFHEDIIPSFCILAYDSTDVQPWAKPGAPPNAWGEPVDTTFRIRGHRQGAKYLASQLIEQNFDLAYAYRPLHVPLGHAFINSLMFLDWDRRGFDFPVVPFAINCYGRKVIATQGYMESLANPIPEANFDPPSPSPTRCFDLGAACARVLSNSRWRVAMLASSSWSHAFMTRKHSFLYPDTAADRALFDALKACNYEKWRATTLSQIEDSGQHELLNWFCLVGAMAELRRAPDYAAFVETNIMNSNKVIAVYSP